MSGAGASVSGLIQAARAGQAGALDRLLHQYRNYLSFLARSGLDSTLGAKAGASDVVQETLLSAFRNFGQFRGGCEGELVAWLRQILAHNLAMLVRRFRGTAARDVARERAVERAVDRSAGALVTLLPAPTDTPSQAAEERERSVILVDALAELPEDERAVLRLRSLQQLEWEEVGRQMGRNADAARKLWTRALRALGERIEGRDL
jgi:RNA polymerase sigma-70 factor (ECF subfamily)